MNQQYYILVLNFQADSEIIVHKILIFALLKSLDV